MAIQLNDAIREEAKKMSEFIVDDTKRTVEMLKWLKSGKETNPVSTAIEIGSALATGQILKGVTLISETIMPRLRDRLDSKLEVNPVPNIAAIDAIKEANEKVIAIRSTLASGVYNAHDLDDICYDIQVILSNALSTL